MSNMLVLDSKTDLVSAIPRILPYRGRSISRISGDLSNGRQ